jgi:hypothetical protein
VTRWDKSHAAGPMRLRQDAPTRSGNIKKLLAAGAILGGGIAANRALTEKEAPPLPLRPYT